MIPEEEDDPNFRLQEASSAEKLLESVKKGQKHLEATFGSFGKMATCSVSEKESKSTNVIQEYNQNRVGDIVQIQENTPRGS